MRFAGRTHPGRREGRNEDVIGWSEGEKLWLVADGMGGHASGDVASRIVKQTLLGEARQLPLEMALRRAHEAVVAAARSDAAHTNMGSTAVAVRVLNRRAVIAWVGDSRAYLWRGQSLRQLSRDHSVLEMLRQQGSLSEAQLRSHPNKNLVTQTLGLGDPQASVLVQPLRKGDRLLLCSDGLNDELEDAQIAELLRTHPQPDAAADALIAAALAKGGRDNVSAVVVEYDGPDGVIFGRLLPLQVRRWLPMLVGTLAALLVALMWWGNHGR